MERIAPGKKIASSQSVGGWGGATRRLSPFDKTERGVACDEDFYAEHEVLGYVISPRRWDTTRRMVKLKNEGGTACGNPGKIVL